MHGVLGAWGSGQQVTGRVSWGAARLQPRDQQQTALLRQKLGHGLPDCVGIRGKETHFL